jgi:hypothetical protein
MRVQVRFCVPQSICPPRTVYFYVFFLTLLKIKIIDADAEILTCAYACFFSFGWVYSFVQYLESTLTQIRENKANLLTEAQLKLDFLRAELNGMLTNSYTIGFYCCGVIVLRS